MHLHVAGLAQSFLAQMSDDAQDFAEKTGIIKGDLELPRTGEYKMHMAGTRTVRILTLELFGYDRECAFFAMVSDSSELLDPGVQSHGIALGKEVVTLAATPLNYSETKPTGWIVVIAGA
jgi:hypothetical protein